MSDTAVVVASVRHRDAVLSFTADNSGKLSYRVLDTARPHRENTSDDERWTDPVPLLLPTEVRDLGLTLLTVDSDETTTAAQTAAGTDMQALSDGDFIYLFRQSAAGSLLMNRFVMATTTVTPDSSEDSTGADQSGDTSDAANTQSRIQEVQLVWELRYVQSGRKDAPAGPKDTLSYTDALGEPFIEPTIQLGMIQHLANGAFAVALTPTGKPDRDVWQFFAFDSTAKKLNLFTIPRSGNGLFDLSESSWKPAWSTFIKSSSVGGNPVSQIIPAGMSAVVYAQQEEVPTDTGQSVSVKRRVRLMLAAALRADGQSAPADGDPLCIVDFGVNADGILPPVSKLPLAAIPQTGSMPDLSVDNSLPEGTLLGGVLQESVNGGLNEVKTKTAPHLLDSADGLVHAYYADGTTSNLSVAEYNTTTARALLKVPIGGGELLFLARQPGTGMVTASVKIEPELDGSGTAIEGFCKVTLASGPGTTADVETWRMVPTDSQQLATILNGEAVFLPFEDGNVQLGQKVFYDYTGGQSQGMRAIYSAPADYGAVWFLARPPAISVNLQETSVTLTEEESPADMPLCTIDLKLTRRRTLNPQGGWTTYNGYAAAANPKISAIASDDTNGQVYFADYDNGLIALDVASDVWSVAGFGIPDPTGYHPTCLTVDSSGQVWMGSDQSPVFNYFDGRMSWSPQFNTDQLTGGTGTSVGGFAVDDHDVLWLVAQDQVEKVYFLKFDSSSKSFEQVAHYTSVGLDTSESNVVSVFTVDDAVFAGTQMGVVRYQPNQGSSNENGFHGSPSLHGGERFTAMAPSLATGTSSALNAGTNLGNFFWVDPTDGNSGPVTLYSNPELVGGRFNSLLRITNSESAFTTQSTPDKVGGSIGEMPSNSSTAIGGATGDPNLPAIALGLDKTDSQEPKLWASVWDTSSNASAGGGFLIRYNYTTGQQSKFSGSKLPNGNVLSIARDDSGAMWVGTAHGGLVKVDAGIATTISGNVTAPDDVQALAANPTTFSGGVWTGSSLSGARLFPVAAGEGFQPTVVIDSTNGLGSNDVRSLAADDNGRLWIGTKDAGLYQATWDGTAVSNVSKVAAVDVDDIRAVAIDHEGDAWVGTNSGVYRIDSNGDLVTQLTHQDGGLAANDVKGIAVGLAGDIWVAAFGGLSRVRDTGTVVENITQTDGLASKWLNCVAVDSDGNVWVGTQGSGVTKYPPLHPELVVTYTPADGLVDDIVRAVGSNLDGELFFGTDRGLSTFTPSGPLTFTERWPNVPRSPAEMLSVLSGTAHGVEPPNYRYNYGAATSSLPNADLSAGSFLFSAIDAGAVQALAAGVTSPPGLVKADGVEITKTVPQGAGRIGASGLFRVMPDGIPNDKQLFSIANGTSLKGVLQNQSELIDNAWRIGVSDQAALQFSTTGTGVFTSGGYVSIKNQERLDLSEDISLQSWVRPEKPTAVPSSGAALQKADFPRVIHRNHKDQKMFLAVGPADYGLQLNPGNPPNPYHAGDGSFLQLDSMQTPLNEMTVELWLMFDSFTSWDGSGIQTVLCKLDDDGNRFLNVYWQNGKFPGAADSNGAFYSKLGDPVTSAGIPTFPTQEALDSYRDGNFGEPGFVLTTAQPFHLAVSFSQVTRDVSGQSHTDVVMSITLDGELAQETLAADLSLDNYAGKLDRYPWVVGTYLETESLHATKFLQGVVDELRFWGSGYSQNKLEDNWNRRIQGDEYGLIAYLRLNDGPGATRVFDLSRNGVNATIVPSVASGVGDSRANWVHSLSPGIEGTSYSGNWGFSAAVGDDQVLTTTSVRLPFDDWAQISTTYRWGQCLTFAPSADAGGESDAVIPAVDLSNAPDLNPTEAMTIAVWVRGSDPVMKVPVGTAFSRYGRDPEAGSYSLIVQNDGTVKFQISLANPVKETDSSQPLRDKLSKGNITFSVQSEQKLSTDGWHLVVATFLGQSSQSPQQKTSSDASLQLYVDGVASEVVKLENDAKIVIRSSSARTYIGRIDDDDAPQALNGRVQSASLWNRAWSAKEAKSAFVHQELPADKSGLIGYWPLSAGTGNAAVDLAGKANGKLSKSVEWQQTRLGGQWRMFLDGELLPAARSVSRSHQGGDIRGGYGSGESFLLGARSELTNGDPEKPIKQSSFYVGGMDEVRVWSRALLPLEVRRDAYRMLAGDEKGLQTYWQFNEGASSTHPLVIDSTGHGYQGHLEGSPKPVYSTAQISLAGVEAPIVSNQVADPQVTDTPHVVTVSARPGVVEYGRLEVDATGAVAGGDVDRCYTWLHSAKQFQSDAAYYVGPVTPVYIGQAQSAPSLVGYIEGAPPVPSENMAIDARWSPDDYVGASSVTLSHSNSDTITFSASRNNGFDFSTYFKAGVAIKNSRSFSGIGVGGVEQQAELKAGVRADFANTLGWLASANTSASEQTDYQSGMSLAGRWEYGQNLVNPNIGRRYLPHNVGYALVVSSVADVYALVLPRSGATLGYSSLPNKDIKPDRNIITFQIDPTYTKNGVLDGMVGFVPDPDCARSVDGAGSYFKPRETEQLLETLDEQAGSAARAYEDFNATSVGQRKKHRHFSSQDPGNAGVSPGNSLPDNPYVEFEGKDPHAKRGLVNSYVWTADGGLYTEQQNFSATREESKGGQYHFLGKAGFYLNASFGVEASAEVGIGVLSAKTALYLGGEFETLMQFGGHIDVTVNKTDKEAATFGLACTVDAERFLDAKLDPDDPASAYLPTREPGKVDAYRFKSFYLYPTSDNTDHFFETVVDRNWLMHSNDSNAVALRAVTDRTASTWRVLHRVTYVSRVPPREQTQPRQTAGRPADPPTDQAINQNAWLIRAVETVTDPKLNPDQPRTITVSKIALAVKDLLDNKLDNLDPVFTQLNQQATGTTPEAPRAAAELKTIRNSMTAFLTRYYGLE